MPFCPKCKYEYKEGIKVCSDCGVELVDVLTDNMLAILEKDEATVDEALDFLCTNGASYAYKEAVDETAGIFSIMVPESKAKEAVSMLTVYYREIHVNSEDEDAKEAQPVREISHSYVDSNDRAENYKSGAGVLIGVGLLGIVALLLINLGIIAVNFPKSTMVMIDVVMGALFVIFILVGCNSYVSYKKLKKQAGEEESLEDRINEWADSALSYESLNVTVNEDDSDEIKFFSRTEELRKQLEEAFPGLDDSFKEHIIENLYDRIYGCE